MIAAGICLATCIAVFGINAGIELVENRGIEQILVAEEAKSLQVLERNVESDDLIAILRSQGLEDDEIQKTLDDYAAVIALYAPDEATVETFINMTKEGKNLQKICEIYCFLTDTIEGNTLLKDMYEIGTMTNFSGNFWLESSYNYLTEKKHGVLSMEEIVAYKNKGISIDEISTASVLSRGGNGTITEILDRRAAGESWEKIFDTYYQKKSLNLQKKFNKTEASTLLEGIQNANTCDLSVEACIENQAEVINVQNKKMIQARKFSEKAGKSLKKKADLTESIYESVSAAGATIEMVQEWQDAGYTSGEIKKAAEISQKYNSSIENVLTQYTTENKWIGE